MTGEAFDPMRLAKRLDAMSDKRTRYGTLPELAAAIENARARWPKCRKYAEGIWTDAYRDYLEAHPKGDKSRIRFARLWVEHVDGTDSEETQFLIKAWSRHLGSRSA